MEIVTVRPEHVDALHAIYLAQVRDSPHSCFASDYARFRDGLLGRVTPPMSIFDIPVKSQTFVAEASGMAQGFATLVTSRNEDDSEKEEQAIFGLFFANDEAGHALIEACEAQAITSELGAFPASHGYTPMHTYNAGWDGLSDRVPHVAQLLTKRGYIPYFRELHLIAPLTSMQQVTGVLPPEVTIILPDGPVTHLDTQRVRALEGETRVGICSYSTLALLTAEPAASRTGYIWWLHVEEAYRRRGIARTLMIATMNQLIMHGCTACWLTTTADNWGAQSLYSSLDFEVVDCSVSFRKQLKA